jgi:hypothetical protein
MWTGSGETRWSSFTKDGEGSLDIDLAMRAALRRRKREGSLDIERPGGNQR